MRLRFFGVSYVTGSHRLEQGVAKRCRLSWLTNVQYELVNEPKCGGRGDEYSCTHGAHINFWHESIFNINYDTSPSDT
jgi:hypothetical protein